MRKQPIKKPKTKSVHILFDNDEYERLADAARNAHLPFGTWVRSTLLKIAAVGAALLMLGCGRALPYEDQADLPLAAKTDATQAAVTDFSEPPDLWTDDAICDPTSSLCCVSAAQADCTAPAGSNGCPPDKCRGYKAPDGITCSTTPCRIATMVICCGDIGSGCPAGECHAF